MEASPTTADHSTLPPQDKWLPADDRIPELLGAVGDGDREPSNGLPLNGGEPLQPPESADDYRSEDSAGKSFREKQVKVPSFPSCLYCLSPLPRFLWSACFASVQCLSLDLISWIDPIDST